MSKTITELGPREAEFISLFSTRHAGFFNLEEARKFWKNTKLTYDVILRLERKGWLERIEAGKYMIVPLEAGPTRTWSADSYIVASELVQPAAISYWTAIRHWNWTEQIPRIVYVQTTKRKHVRRREVLGVPYEFVTVKPNKFFGHVNEWREGRQVLVTSREKTLVDCADDVPRAGTIEELAKAVQSAVSEISWIKLDEYVRQFPNGAVKKRLGFLFEVLVRNLPGSAKETLESWRANLTSGFVPLEPHGNRGGKLISRWSIRINADIP